MSARSLLASVILLLGTGALAGPREDASAIRAAHPELAAAVDAWTPVPTRAGTWRLPGDLPPQHDGDLVAALLVAEVLDPSAEAPARLAAAEWLARDGRYATQILAAWPQVTEPDLRSLLAGCLEDASQGWATKGLALAAADADPGVRAEAVRIAGHRSDLDLADLLLDALADSDAGVRAVAARGLGWRQHAAAFAPVAALLSDGDAEVRLQALRALQRIDAAGAARLPAVAALRLDPDPRVARAAAQVQQ